MLVGLEADARAAWSLVLALSNRSEALLHLGKHEAVLEDVTDAVVLLERSAARFDAVLAAKIRDKLTRREQASTCELEATHRQGERAEAQRRAAEQRAQTRADRRRRAKDARAAQRAQEAAAASAAAQEMDEAMAALAVDVSEPEPESECFICVEGNDAGPLEDVCGHGHLLHPGCASLWRIQCFKLQQSEPDKHQGPHCPMCRRPI